MAEAASDDVRTMECGFCLQRGDSVDDPRILPCSHIHCSECLTAKYNIHGVIQCPLQLCSEVFDVTPEGLPLASSGEEKSVPCDICTKKGVANQPAVVYCTLCAKKYCEKHQESHDDLQEDHPKLSVEEYKKQARKLEIRMCSEHNNQPYSMGCRVCLTVICVKCTSEMDNCTDGQKHTLIPLDELVTELTYQINELRVKVSDKEEILSALFKLTSKTISEYETRTEEMIQTLHETRDKQLEAIRLKYDLLEVDLIELRGKLKSEMTRFMEEDVGVKLSDLSKHQMRIEARLKNSHQVEVVGRYRDTKHEINTLVEDEMPTLELTDIMVLQRAGENTAIELEMVSEGNVFIELEHGLKICKSIPTSLNLLKSVKVSHYCIAACHSQGNTYVGLYNNAVDKLDENYKLHSSFLNLNNHVSAVTVYKDRIYTLVYGTPCTIIVHDFDGQLITKWNHNDNTANTAIKFVVVADSLAVPDRQNKRLTLYTLTGELIKHIPCSQLSNSATAMCAAGTNSVIISNQRSSEIFRLNISTGEVTWTSKHVANPGALTLYRRNNVLVSKRAVNTTIWILDVKTGDLLSELTDSTARVNSQVFDLHITDDTLIVPRYDEQTVLFYQLV